MPTQLQERIAECEGAAALGLPLATLLQQGLEGTHIGILRLVGGSTLAIEVAGGCISRRGEKIADIPNLDVLKSPEALITHLQSTTNLQIAGLE